MDYKPMPMNHSPTMTKTTSRPSSSLSTSRTFESSSRPMSRDYSMDKTDQGNVIKIRSSVTNLSMDKYSSLSRSGPIENYQTKPIPGSQYEEICSPSPKKDELKQTIGSSTAVGGALLDGDYDEELQQRLFRDAVNSWRGTSETKIIAETRMGEAISGASQSPQITTPRAHTPGGTLMNGSYDEALQQRLFKDAVMAWRGEKPPQQQRPQTATCNAETSSDPLPERRGIGSSVFQTEFLENLRIATRYTYFDTHFRV